MSSRNRFLRERIVSGLKSLSEAGAKRAVVNGAANLEQKIRPSPRPAHLLLVWTAPGGIDCARLRSVTDLRQRRPSVDQIGRTGMDTLKHVLQLHEVNAAIYSCAGSPV